MEADLPVAIVRRQLPWVLSSGTRVLTTQAGLKLAYVSEDELEFLVLLTHYLLSAGMASTRN